MLSHVSSSFLNRRFTFFFRENMIAGYYYLGTSNCKSISFPAYLFCPSPFTPGDRYFRSPVNFSSPESKPRGVRFSIVLVPFLVQSRQPNVRRNYWHMALKYRDWPWLNVSCSRFNAPDIREATVAKTSFKKLFGILLKFVTVTFTG